MVNFVTQGRERARYGGPKLSFIVKRPFSANTPFSANIVRTQFGASSESATSSGAIDSRDLRAGLERLKLELYELQEKDDRIRFIGRS